MEAQLAKLVEYYLSCHLHENAMHLCETLFSVAPTETNRHLLANCYVSGGRRRQAIELLKGSSSPINRFLRARYLLEEGETGEAEETLLGGTPFLHVTVSVAIQHLRHGMSAVPNQAAGVYLWGRILEQRQQIDDACRLYSLVLDVDPFNWDAFSRLSAFGKAPAPASAFSLPDTLSEMAAAFGAAGGTSDPDGALASVQAALQALTTGGGSLDAALAQGDVAERLMASVRAPLLASRAVLAAAARAVAPVAAAPPPPPSDSTGGPTTEESVPRVPKSVRRMKDQRSRLLDKASPLPQFLLGSDSKFSGSLSPAALRSFGSGDLFPLVDKSTPSQRLDSARRALSGTTKEPTEGLPSSATPSDEMRRRGGRLAKEEVDEDEEEDAEAAGSSPVREHPMSVARAAVAFSAARAVSMRGTTPLRDFPGLATPMTTTSFFGTPNRVVAGQADPSIEFERALEAAAEAFSPFHHHRVPDAPSATAESAAALTSLTEEDMATGAVCGAQLLSLQQVLELLRGMASVQLQVDRHNLKLATDAVRGVDSLTAWVALQMGIAYFNAGQYRKVRRTVKLVWLVAMRWLQAVQFFTTMQSEAPYWTHATDLFSTALWHLKDRPSLAVLMRHLAQVAPGSSEACIAAGNLHSLEGKHPQALALFVRAAQAGPNAATALTLAGHEESAQGNVDEAMRFYREAIARNPRQYNAWFGLVSVSNKL
jgi:tetratricopeptide (TPR) repeat protein